MATVKKRQLVEIVMVKKRFLIRSIRNFDKKNGKFLQWNLQCKMSRIKLNDWVLIDSERSVEVLFQCAVHLQLLKVKWNDCIES